MVRERFRRAAALACKGRVPEIRRRLKVFHATPNFAGGRLAG